MTVEDNLSRLHAVCMPMLDQATHLYVKLNTDIAILLSFFVFRTVVFILLAPIILFID